LINGVLFGNKLCWSNWGSAFNVETGFVENGPALRNISVFPVDINSETGMVRAFLPKEEIPQFSRQKIIPRDPKVNQKFVIIGDTLATLGAITALRLYFGGEIKIISNGEPNKSFVDRKQLIQNCKPMKIDQQYIVDKKFLQQNYCEMMRGKKIDDIEQIDSHGKRIIFKDGSEERYTKCLIAWGAYKEETPFDIYENVYSMESVHDHAKIYNAVKNAKTVLIYGNSIEAYELTSNIKELSESFGNDTKIYLLEPPTSEIKRSFTEQLHNVIKSEFYVKGVYVLTEYNINSIKMAPGTLDVGRVVIADPKSEKETMILKPDVVITESNLGNSRLKLGKVYSDITGRYLPSILETDICTVDSLFSLQYDNLYSTLFAAGIWAMVDSEYKNISFRQPDSQYEVDSGFYAGLSMVNRRINRKSNWITLENASDVKPMTWFRILGNEFAFIGERNPIYTDVIVEGDLKSLKFVMYLFNLEKQKNSKTKHFEDQCVGILVWNMPQIQLWLREAMNLNLIPNLSQFKGKTLVRKQLGFKNISETIMVSH
jgi:hypothetical protein